MSFRCRSFAKSWISSGVSLILRACLSRTNSAGSAVSDGEARPDDDDEEDDEDKDEAVFGGDDTDIMACICDIGSNSLLLLMLPTTAAVDVRVRGGGRFAADELNDCGLWLFGDNDEADEGEADGDDVNEDTFVVVVVMGDELNDVARCTDFRKESS